MEEATALLEVCEIKLASAQYGSALALAQDAWGLLGNQSKGATAIRLMVRAHWEQELFREALAVAEKHWAHFKAASDPRVKGVVMLSVAEANVGLERYQEALRLAASAADGFKRVRDRGAQASALRVGALAGLRLGSAWGTKRALSMAEEALGLQRALGERKEEAALLLLIAQAHLRRAEFDDAYAFAKGSFELSQSVGHTKGAAAALLRMADVLLAINDEPEAVVQVAQEALAMLQRLGDWLGEISAQMAIAKGHRADGLVNYAIEALEAALAIARKLKDRRRIGEVITAMVELMPADFALQTMEEEATSARAAGDLKRQMFALQGIVGLQLALSKPEVALREAERGVSLAREAGDPSVEALALRLVAEVQVQSKCLPAALSALSDAKGVLQGCGDVRGCSQVLQLMGTIHETLGDNRESLRCTLERRSAFKAAGWRDEEAAALLHSATLHGKCTGAHDAAKAAQDAIALFKELGDKSGEASAMVALANFQRFAKGGRSDALRTVQAARHGEALRTVRAAQELLRSVGDAAGEAQALQAASELHIAQGARDEAIKAAKEGVRVCQRAGDTKGEADSLRALSVVHTHLIESDIDDGLKPDKQALREAMELTIDSATAFQVLGDLPGQAGALTQLSTLNRLAKCGEEAVAAAQEAMTLLEKANAPEAEAAALLAMAEARLLVRRRRDALEAAEDARGLFEELRDAEGVKDAEKVMERAVALPDAGQLALSGESAAPCGGGSLSPSGEEQQEGTGPEEQEGAAPLGAAAEELAEDLDAEAQAEIEESWRTVAALEEAAERRRDALLPRLDGEPAPPAQPPAVARERWPHLRQAALAAAAQEAEPLPDARLQADARPQLDARPPGAPRVGELIAEIEGGVRSRRGGGPDAPPPETLAAVLQAVRPDWTSKEVTAVVEKLAKVGVDSSAELFRRLRTEGAQSVNARLKAIGQKALRLDTLEALRERGDRLSSDAARGA